MTRVVGDLALGAGLLIAAFGYFTDFAISAEGFLMTSLLVATGIGLRIEAALKDREPARDEVRDDDEALLD